MTTSDDPQRLTGLKVFVSYPRGGSAHTCAEKVQRDLEARGAGVFRDEASVAPGTDDWCRAIEQGLRHADTMVVIVDSSSEVCRWQRREVLQADRLSLPMTLLRVEAVDLPFFVIERQPIEVRSADAAGTLDTLAERLASIRSAAATAVAAATRTAGVTVPPPQRRREEAWLRNLLHVDLSDREDRWVPLAGHERAAPALERSHKGLRLDTMALLRQFGITAQGHARPTETSYADVLDAYRSLAGRRIRRLAVLGEPGAGKTFSLQRIAVDYARRALADPVAPLPLLVSLGLWTREGEPLQDLIERQLGALGRDFEALREQHRAVLLLDAMNEIPVAQRHAKAVQIRQLAGDERFASVVVSCRERDFAADFALPFDTLTLQPLTPPQVLQFLQRAYTLQFGHDAGLTAAEQRFWQMAGGAPMRDVWQAWQRARASFEQFWSADDVPRDEPDVFSRTTGEQDEQWRHVRHDARGLIRLAANPYLLLVMSALPSLPANRMQLFEGFMDHLYERERKAREDRHDAAGVPERGAWEQVLVALAETMQAVPRGATGDDTGGARTAIAHASWPAGATPAIIAFSIDASVLRLDGDDLRFTHQLLQEALATRELLRGARTNAFVASRFWPVARWWQPSGWEVVAQLAGEACGAERDALLQLVAWLAEANPEVAESAWRAGDAPALPAALAGAIQHRWLAAMIDPAVEPRPEARAAIGRALGRFSLDDRKGVGLRADGLPDVDWVTIPGDHAFVYQDGQRMTIPTFEIARHPVTNAQFQAFVDAGGYADDQWWSGLGQRFGAPEPPEWDEPNAPRETLSWYEAVAFCRWLATSLGEPIGLPHEVQWERAARGTNGSEYPWGIGWKARAANCQDHVNSGSFLGRTSAVGLYPKGASVEGVLDLSGNVWEWCRNEFVDSTTVSVDDRGPRALRGGSWGYAPAYARATSRIGFDPGVHLNYVGFRVCRGSPIE